jgi:hypothetical protein
MRREHRESGLTPEGGESAENLAGERHYVWC